MNAHLSAPCLAKPGANMRTIAACLAAALLLLTGCGQPVGSTASGSTTPEAWNPSLECDDPDQQATTYLDYESGTGEVDKESAMRVAQEAGVLAQGRIVVGDAQVGRVVGADDVAVAEVQLEHLDAGWVVSTVESCG